MPEKIYIVEGRQFRSESDQKLARADLEIIEKLRERLKTASLEECKRLQKALRENRYHFNTVLGQDFADEVDEKIKSLERGKGTNAATRSDRFDRSDRLDKSDAAGRGNDSATRKTHQEVDPKIELYAKQMLRKREKRRRILIIACLVLAVGSLGYYGIYTYYEYRTSQSYQMLTNIKENAASQETSVKQEQKVEIHYTDDSVVVPDVLPQYQDLYNKNQKFIGWIKITSVENSKESPILDHPVMQTTDNEYYLSHNMQQQYDKLGTVFMDKDCDVLKPSTNWILYGHHTKTGKMFGAIEKYEKEDFWKAHPYISFDTIYETGTYAVMYVFRARVLTEADTSFKYYEFIDAYSEVEFDSYMAEMAAASFYDTGVTAQYGDHLLTLSTCDYEQTNGRFVVVAKKID